MPYYRVVLASRGETESFYVEADSATMAATRARLGAGFYVDPRWKSARVERVVQIKRDIESNPMNVDNYVVLFEHGSYKGIVGPYTPDVAKKTIQYWKRNSMRRHKRTAYIVKASSHDEAYSKTLRWTASGPKENPLEPGQVLAYYNGKVVDMKYVPEGRQRFNLAAMRIVDNGAEGYVLEISKKGSKLFFVAKGSRTSKLVTDPATRDRVLAEIGALAPNPISTTSTAFIGTATIGVAAAVLYFLTKPAAAATTTTTTSTGGGLPPGTISLSSSDSGNTIPASVGDTVIIDLPPPPAGQAWVEIDAPSGVLVYQGSNTNENLYRANSIGTVTATFTLTDANNNAVAGTAPLVFTIVVS